MTKKCEEYTYEDEMWPNRFAKIKKGQKYPKQEEEGSVANLKSDDNKESDKYFHNARSEYSKKWREGEKLSEIVAGDDI